MKNKQNMNGFKPTCRSISLFLLLVKVSESSKFRFSLNDTLRRTDGVSSKPPPDKASDVFVESERFSPSDGGLTTSYAQTNEQTSELTCTTMLLLQTH